MIGTKQEYERFLVWLEGQEGVSADARRVANLVHAHFEEVEATSAYQSQRSKSLVPCLLRDLEATSDALPDFDDDAPEADAQFLRLHSLEVGPFRGFQLAEPFDLDARIVLFYGPNGTGKTSLCEALEYCLLGEVAEGASKRIEQEAYLRNVFTDAYAPPRLLGSTSDGTQVEVVHNNAAFRFCFIEKNRIDAFSRIAARSAAQRTELIATLFGLDGFTEFVRGFNQEIEGQLALQDQQRQLLAQRKSALITDNALVVSEAADFQALSREEEALALEYAPATSYVALLTLLGTPDAPGRLQHLEQVLREPEATEWGITLAGVTGARQDTIEQLARAEELAAQLERRRGEVNFITLFEAVRDLESDEEVRCPACDTPLAGESHVVRNPFEKARTGLADLANLAAIQQQHEVEVAEVARLSGELVERLRRVSEYARAVEPGGPAAVALNDVPLEPHGQWWKVLDVLEAEDGVPTKWEALEAAARDAESHDADAKRCNAAWNGLVAERDRLNQFNLRLVVQQTKRTQHSQRLGEACGRIAAFEEANRPLVEAVEAELARIAHHTRIQSAYSEFLGQLRAYRAGLPAALLADLNQTTRQLYNAFNRTQPEPDKLAVLTLPVDENQKIEIAFNSHPEKVVDALQVLSEGGIRCLGLAILVAKNLQLNCPVLIFDDAVNAIDTMHRIGIRDTLFKDNEFREKQILLTCHGEELIKDIEQIVGHIEAGDSCLSYTFLPHAGDRNIRVGPSASRNYILEARQLLLDGRGRSAIASARRAMESINDRTWSLLIKKGLGELKLTKDGPNAPLNQNNLASVLKKEIGKATFVDERKDGLIAGYEFMLRPTEWAVFNTLTHERAGVEEIPQETMHAVIENLAALDILLSPREGAGL